MRLLIFLSFTLATISAIAIEPKFLAKEIELAEQWAVSASQPNCYQSNYHLQSGALFTPSAYPYPYGTLGAGASQSFPHKSINLVAQPFNRLQLQGNFRLFDRLPSLDLGDKYGEKSDKGLGLKFLIIGPEDFASNFPYISIGADDFLGTKAFKSYYAVASQSYFDQVLDLSLGYGTGHLKGGFGSLCLSARELIFPLDQLSFILEYDATRYQNSAYTHDLYQEAVKNHLVSKKGIDFYQNLITNNQIKTPFNLGIFLRIGDMLNLSVSYNRGKHWGGSFAFLKNMERTKEFIPKIHSPLPYSAPKNHEAIGELRPLTELPYEFYYAFKHQGFSLRQIYHNKEEKNLYLFVENEWYWNPEKAKEKLIHILATLAPKNIEKFTLHNQSNGVITHSYHFSNNQLMKFKKGQQALEELLIINPSQDYKKGSELENYKPLFKEKAPLFSFTLQPDILTFLGSSKGKVKYALGLKVPVKGFLTDSTFYRFQAAYNPLSNFHNLSDRDKNNPSQLINVQSDKSRYLKEKKLRINELYVQKNVMLKPHTFMRLSGGYFNFAYAGIASEVLYSPVNSLFAWGGELAVLKKRKYSGLGLTSRIRQLHGIEPSYPKFLGVQAFFDSYFKIPALEAHLKVSVGQFLAKDKGIRFLFSKNFSSGLELSSWITATNANDRVNGARYRDYGFKLSMPIDVFCSRRYKSRWHYGLSAWLRDVGYRSTSGEELHETITKEQF